MCPKHRRRIRMLLHKNQGSKIFYLYSVFALSGTVCAFCFCVGLIFTTGAGEYWLKMFDSFAGTIGLVVVALLEMVSVVYIYGHDK